VIAWCARCDGPQDCDERGCIVCAVIHEKAAASSKRRRDRLRASARCINGPSHGALAPGRDKCERCVEVHRRTA
jgi:hypothetical protein